MQAVVLPELGGPGALEVRRMEAPDRDDAVIIEVHAAGVAFADLLMTRGRYQARPEPPFVPGVDMAGTVRRAPAGSGFAVGDRVAASGMGAWAEVAAAAPASTFPIPAGMSFEQATSLINYQTGYFGLAVRGDLRAGEIVLVHGAAGGVGTAAVQIAAGLGAKVIAVAQGKEKCSIAVAAGASHALDADGDWLTEAKAISGGSGVGMVYDPVGGDRFTDSLRALAPGGRLLVVGFAGGEIPQVKVNRLLLHNTSVIGVAWPEWVRTHPDAPPRVAAGLQRLWDSGHVRPIVGEVFPLDGAADALRAIEDRRATGKIVLRVR
ncbi:MAG TPA: NADPH:quinone oxidoreductase family protein [Dehalococcoidia bacterium]|nr:NADPH:quinone oxidoreductase family protein [Dehalococcoidia bacterium]